jgi:hypothetical protein
MMDTDQLEKLVQTCCDVFNIARELDIDISREFDALTKKILAVSDAACVADLENLRAALRPNSLAVH